jgi:hypothetical protein
MSFSDGLSQPSVSRGRLLHFPHPEVPVGDTPEQATRTTPSHMLVGTSSGTSVDRGCVEP